MKLDRKVLADSLSLIVKLDVRNQALSILNSTLIVPSGDHVKLVKTDLNVGLVLHVPAEGAYSPEVVVGLGTSSTS